MRIPKVSQKKAYQVRQKKKLSIKLDKTNSLRNICSDYIVPLDWHKHMVENMQSGVWIADKKLRIIYVNPAICRLLEYTQEEMIGRHEFDLWGPKTLEKVKRIVVTDRKSGISSSYEGGIITKSGKRIDILSHGTPLSGGGTVVIVTDIREIKKKDEALVKSEKRFKNLANLLPQAVFEISAEGELLFVNQEAYKLFGYTENNFNEWGNPFNMIAKKDRLRAIKNMYNVLRTKDPISTEYIALRKDGTTFSASVYANPILKDGKAIGIRGILIDITESKRAKELTIKLRSATEQSMDGVAMTNLNGDIEFVNPAWAKMHGYNAKNLLGKNLSIFHSKDQMKYEVIPFNKKVFKAGGCQGEVGHVKLDGTEFSTFMSTTLIRDEKSQPIGLVKTAHDITKQKEAELIIEKRIREFNVLYRIHSRIRMSNSLSRVLTDISRDVVHALKFVDIAQTCVVFDGKNYESSKNCKPFECMIEESIVIRGKKRGILKVGYTEIPPHKKKEFFWQAERRLIKTVVQIVARHILSREVYERYQKIVQKSVTGIFILDNGIIKEVNSRFGKIFKCKSEDVVGQNISEFINGYADHVELSDSETATCTCLTKGVRKDGEIIDVDIVSQKINFHGKKSILGRVHDITKLKAAEEKLRNFNDELKEMVAEKTYHLELANKRLQSLNELKDEFIAISSHELRSPLTSIRGYLSFLVEEESLELIPNPARRYLMRAYNNAESLNYLVNNILDVSRLDTGRFELQIVECDLIQLVQNVIEGLSFQISEKNLNLDVRNLTKLEKLPIKVDTIRLTQVLRNLLDNAIKFSKRGKSIVVEIKVTLNFIEISVIDEGVGIPKSQIEYVFDKFIQVKSTETRYKGGAGLGLFISKRIIELHGGIMKAESEIHKGATFTIQLPLE